MAVTDMVQLWRGGTVARASREPTPLGVFHRPLRSSCQCASRATRAECVFVLMLTNVTLSLKLSILEKEYRHMERDLRIANTRTRSSTHAAIDSNCNAYASILAARSAPPRTPCHHAPYTMQTMRYNLHASVCGFVSTPAGSPRSIPTCAGRVTATASDSSARPPSPCCPRLLAPLHAPPLPTAVLSANARLCWREAGPPALGVSAGATACSAAVTATMGARARLYVRYSVSLPEMREMSKEQSSTDQSQLGGNLPVAHTAMPSLCRRLFEACQI